MTPTGPPPEEDAARAELPTIRSPRDAAQLVAHISALDHEQFHVLGLDATYRVLTNHCVGIGSLDRVSVSTLDVFRELVRLNCRTFIAFHNHPSGDPHPSSGDLDLTLRLQLAGVLLGLPLLDHIILARGCFYSTREEALYPLGG